jgi:uncharacterized membrane protein
MNDALFRFFIALLVAALLLRQAQRAKPRSRRRGAFLLAMGAFGLFGLLNLLEIVGFFSNLLTPILMVVAFALLVASLVMLILAWRSGEMTEQLDRVRQAVADERQRRTANDE